LKAVIEAALREGIQVDGEVIAHIDSDIPVAAGLGSSAAVAVAFAGALVLAYTGSLERDLVNRLAFESERYVHGRPSGIDNTIATYGGTILYRRGSEPTRLTTRLSECSLIVVDSGERRQTGEAVAKVLAFRGRLGPVADELLEFVDRAVDEAVSAAVNGDYGRLGAIMSLFHGLLAGLGVSTPVLDTIVSRLRRIPGVYGAKLTGAGLGGAVIALASSEAVSRVRDELKTIGAEVAVVKPEAEGVREEG
jgi:mevalonate kinase